MATKKWIKIYYLFSFTFHLDIFTSSALQFIPPSSLTAIRPNPHTSSRPNHVTRDCARRDPLVSYSVCPSCDWGAQCVLNGSHQAPIHVFVKPVHYCHEWRQLLDLAMTELQGRFKRVALKSLVITHMPIIAISNAKNRLKIKLRGRIFKSYMNALNIYIKKHCERGT